MSMAKVVDTKAGNARRMRDSEPVRRRFPGSIGVPTADGYRPSRLPTLAFDARAAVILLAVYLRYQPQPG
jgi:hypothetical protein